MSPVESGFEDSALLRLGRICYDSFTLENWIPKVLKMTRKFFSKLEIQSFGEYFVSMDEEREVVYGGFPWAVSRRSKLNRFSTV